MAWKNHGRHGPAGPFSSAGRGVATQSDLGRQTLESKDGNLGVRKEHRTWIRITERRRCGLPP